MISSGDTKDRSTIGRPPAISDQRSFVGLVRTAAVGRAFWAAVRLQWVERRSSMVQLRRHEAADRFGSACNRRSAEIQHHRGSVEPR